jgi:hypothetical protein
MTLFLLLHTYYCVLSAAHIDNSTVDNSTQRGYDLGIVLKCDRPFKFVATQVLALVCAHAHTTPGVAAKDMGDCYFSDLGENDSKLVAMFAAAGCMSPRVFIERADAAIEQERGVGHLMWLCTWMNTLEGLKKEVRMIEPLSCNLHMRRRRPFLCWVIVHFEQILEAFGVDE